MSEALPKKYRPDNFEDFIGNEASVKSVRGLLARDMDKIPSSWLFIGPAGCGKTTMARIIQKELGCHNQSFFEFNSGTKGGIDVIRQIESEADLFAPVGDVKIFFLDEAHRLSGASQEGFLKILEESPKNTFFFLATTEPEKFKKTLMSRCNVVKVSALRPQVIIDQLRWVLDNELNPEDSDAFLAEGILKEIAKVCEGSMRDALKLLDSVIDMDDWNEMEEVIKQGVFDEGEDFIEICNLLKEKTTKWALLEKALTGFIEDPERARRSFHTYFTNIAFRNCDFMMAAIAECFQENYFNVKPISGLKYSILSAYSVLKRTK